MRSNSPGVGPRLPYPGPSSAAATSGRARTRGHPMDQPLRRPDQILAQRPLKQVLATKPKAVWSVAPSDSSLSAMHLMAEKNIGLVVVLDRLALVGVLSERDCVRRIVLVGKSPEATPVANI